MECTSVALLLLTVIASSSGCGGPAAQRRLIPVESAPAAQLADAGAASRDEPGEIDAAVSIALRGRTVGEARSLDMTALCDDVYDRLYGAGAGAPKPATIEQSDYEARLTSHPHIKVTGGWIVRYGVHGVATSELVRFYLDLMPDESVAIADELCQALDDGGIKFEFKVVQRLKSFARTSTAVLYLQRENYLFAKGLMLRIASLRPRGFRTDIPPFTKRLAPGLSVAEEPVPSPIPPTRKAHSHGTVRSDAIAEAIKAAPPGATPADVASLVRERFRFYEIDPDRPWLRQGRHADEL